MLSWSLAFLIVAVLAALFAFGESAPMAVWLSEIGFAISVLLFGFAVAFARKRRKQKA